MKKKQEEFDDTKWVIRIGISQKNRQHNVKRKSTKGQTTILTYEIYFYLVRNELKCQTVSLTILTLVCKAQWCKRQAIYISH